MFKRNDIKKIDSRRYVYKNPKTEFYCPLCATKRSFLTSPRMSKMNWLQMGLITIVLMAMMYPFVQFKSIFVFFIVWAVFEASVRIVFRKEIPCPHCGFDASWYKKDVKIARKLVKEFWDEKEGVQVSEGEPEAEEMPADFMPPPESNQVDRDAYFS